MSKSIGNVINPFELAEKYGIDPVRFFLLREIPSSEDGDFSYEKFEDRYNGDLANGLGNFAARVLTLASNEKLKAMPINPLVENKINETKVLVKQKIEEFKLNEALEAVWKLIHFGDQYVNEKKPWDKSLSEADKIGSIYNAIIILDNIAGLLLPFLPETSEKITSSIKSKKGILAAKKIQNLFPRLEK